MISETLQNIGLSGNELKAYETLLKVGVASAPQIARELNLPRQTIYSIMTKLSQDGFVEQSTKRGVTQFIADPSKLFLLIENKKKILDSSKKTLENEIPKLLKKFQAKNIPKIQYYDGRDGLKRLFESILDLYKKGVTKEFRGYGVNRFKDAIPDNFLANFVKKRGQYNVLTKLFIGNGPDDFGITGEDNSYGRTIKHINMDPQKAALYIVGDRLYLFSYDENVGVMIEHKSMAQLMMAVFESQWDETKHYSGK